MEGRTRSAHDQAEIKRIRVEICDTARYLPWPASVRDDLEAIMVARLGQPRITVAEIIADAVARYREDSTG